MLPPDSFTKLCELLISQYMCNIQHPTEEADQRAVRVKKNAERKAEGFCEEVYPESSDREFRFSHINTSVSEHYEAPIRVRWY